MSSEPFAKAYEPKAVEDRWYSFWEEQGLFAADEENVDAAYSIVIPPPNVTGVLHMGHALNITLQDILCRYRKLKGDSVLWMPGTDHAGIATQNVVEKQLSAEGTSRHELGREKFIEKVWQWREQYGSAIINQLKRLGAMCDWQRERFTMDDGLSEAVRKVFVTLYKEGLIYQGNYIINWCPRCHTALADLEVEHEEHDGHLYHIRYPYVGADGGLTVATTRPETMLGDTAVALNPDDERYRGLAQQSVLLPLMEREIPIIRDGYVDLTFGTGALKVTPAHDPNDFEIGRRHELPSVKVIGDDGRMTDAAGRFAGLERFECRKAVLEALQDEGLLEKIDDLKHNVGHCYRCKTVVEPNLSKQWFVSAAPLAKAAIAAVEDGRTRIIPEMWRKTYYDWMYNIRDWCISRQIWWGHQIPAWTCASCGEMVVETESPQRCPSCGGEDLVQETDVLDTWFSSALWPFSTMGWPEKTKLLQIYYPTSVLVTGFDILFFWVARMMMMGLHFMKDVPFRDVYVHALVRDEDGKKMSKSKGNVIDPLSVIENYGTDAFRYTLAAFAAQGRDVKMSEKRVEGYRHFVNKLWNAARFSMMHVEDAAGSLARSSIGIEDRWILSRLDRVIREVGAALDGYRFNDAASELYQFVWHEFCDWYLELIKPALYGKRPDTEPDATRAVLKTVLANILVMLHPFMPFVTEEIWHQLPGTEGSIMTARFPEPGDQDAAISADADADAEAVMALIMAVITGIRNIRGEMNLAPSLQLSVQVQSPDDGIRQTLETHGGIIADLARLEAFRVGAPGEKPKASATAILDGAAIFVSLEGLIDFQKEQQRLEKEIAKLAADLKAVSKKLSNEDFLDKAPPAVVEKTRDKQLALDERRQKLATHLDRLRDMQA